MPLNLTTYYLAENTSQGPSISGFSPTSGPLGASFTITGARLSGVTNLFLMHPSFADEKKDARGLTSVELLSNSSTGIDFTTGLVKDANLSYVPEANKIAISGVIPTDFPRFPQSIMFRVVTSGFGGTKSKRGMYHEAVTGSFTTYLDDIHINNNLFLHSGNDYESKIYTSKDSAFGYINVDSPSETGIILSSFSL